MKKLLLVLALMFVPTAASAQCTGIFPANTTCGAVTSGVPHPVPFTSIIAPGAPTSYSPGAGCNQATGTVVCTAFGRYQIVGKLVFVQIEISVSGTFTGGNLGSTSLPFPCAITNFHTTFFGHDDTNGIAWMGRLVQTSSTNALQLMNYIGSTTVLTGTIVNIEGWYEIP